jgi:chromosome partitioning protein
MTTVYSIMNFKGGTGKSSIAENLSHALARMGKKVLVIDADRQVNSSSTLLAGQATPTLTNVLKGETSLTSAIKQARENLYVVPSDGDLDTASPYILSHRAAYYFLRKQLEQLTDFFIVLVDQAGAYTPVMEACLLASHAMLIPCELEPYATQGLFGMFKKLGETLVDHELENRGIIPYNVDLRYGMAKQYLKELRQEFNGLVTTAIRTDAIVPKAQSVQMTVFEYEAEYSVKSRAAEDFQTLAEDLLEEIEGATR